MNPDFNLQEELKKLPDRPGVYIMHDRSDAILYVGKAKRSSPGSPEVRIFTSCPRRRNSAAKRCAEILVPLLLVS